jgi:hypothetical protein
VRNGFIRTALVALAFVTALSVLGHAWDPGDDNNQGNEDQRSGPEIDPASATSALALLAGGLLVVRAKRL